MADKLVIFKICDHCQGTGQISATQTTPEEGDNESGTTMVTCPTCKGNKEYVWGRMEEIPQD